MTNINLRGGIEGSINNVELNGFFFGEVVHHEPTGYKIGVYIPKLMPDKFPKEESNDKYEIVTPDESIIKNKEKINIKNKINLSNYILVSPFYWTRKCYRTRKKDGAPDGWKVEHSPNRKRVPAFILTPMEDLSTPSKEVEPHTRYNRIKQEMGADDPGSLVITGGIIISEGIVEHTHEPPKDPSATGAKHAYYDATVERIVAGKMIADKLKMNETTDRDILENTRSENDLTHKWEETVEEIYREAIPQIGETVLVVFIDGAPDKGYYFPFGP